MPRELLFRLTKKDFTVQTFKSGGSGGQHRDKTDSCVRIIHKESGAVGESREQRSQSANKKMAFKRLVKSAKFKIWHNRKIQEVITGETLEQKVKKMMHPSNIKIEVKEKGKWVEVTE